MGERRPSDVPAGWVFCPHCGLWVDPVWGACAHDPATPDGVVKARRNWRLRYDPAAIATFGYGVHGRKAWAEALAESARCHALTRFLSSVLVA
jgi:hypothetical protein